MFFLSIGLNVNLNHFDLMAFYLLPFVNGKIDLEHKRSKGLDIFLTSLYILKLHLKQTPYRQAFYFIFCLGHYFLV